MHRNVGEFEAGFILKWEVIVRFGNGCWDLMGKEGYEMMLVELGIFGPWEWFTIT